MVLLGFIAAIAFLLIVIVLACKKWCLHRLPGAVRNLCLKLKNMLLFNTILRYWMMVFLSFSIGCMMQIQRTTKDPSTWNKVQSILSLIILVTFLVLLYFVQRHLFKNMKRLKEKSFKQSYGTLYTPCDVDKGRKAIIFVTVFCLRRFMVAILVAFLVKHPLAQILLTLSLSTVVMLWHLKVQPMESWQQNLLYSGNEYLYLACCFYTMGFSQYNISAEIRYQSGWLYLVFIGLIVLLNVVVMLFEIIRGIILYCRRRKMQKRLKKVMQERLKNLALKRHSELLHP